MGRIDEATLIRAANQELELVNAIKRAGVFDAGKTVGSAKTNRKLGDVWYKINENDQEQSIELQVSAGGGNRKNFSLNLKKKTKFEGRGGRCYYMFGNEMIQSYIIVEKEYLDNQIDAFDSSSKDRDIVLALFENYVIISPQGLAASGNVKGYGRSISECVANFFEVRTN